MEPFIDNIVRFHTDGWFQNIPLDTEKYNITLGSNLGQLKYKAYCNDFTLHNINDWDGEFVKVKNG
jgi:hypothetical protein